MTIARFNSLIGGALLGTAASLPVLQVGADSGTLVLLVSAACATVGITMHAWNDPWGSE